MGYVSGSDHSTGTTPDAWDVVMNKIDRVLGPCPFDTYTIKGRQLTTFELAPWQVPANVLRMIRCWGPYFRKPWYSVNSVTQSWVLGQWQSKAGKDGKGFPLERGGDGDRGWFCSRWRGQHVQRLEGQRAWNLRDMRALLGSGNIHGCACMKCLLNSVFPISWIVTNPKLIYYDPNPQDLRITFGDTVFKETLRRTRKLGWAPVQCYWDPCKIRRLRQTCPEGEPRADTWWQWLSINQRGWLQKGPSIRHTRLHMETKLQLIETPLLRPWQTKAFSWDS